MQAIPGACRVLLGVDIGVAQVRANPARRDCIDANPVLAEIHRHRPGERVHGTLRGAVGAVFRVRCQSFDGTDVDDAGGACGAQQRQQFTTQKGGCGQVYRQHFVPVLDLHLLERLLEHETGIVDQGIEPVVGCAHRFGNRGVAVDLRQVGLDPLDARPLRQVGGQRVALRDDNRGARVQQGARNPQANAFATAGDHNRLPRQRIHASAVNRFRAGYFDGGAADVARIP